MLDNIPFEIQEEIMKRLPVRSLIQFRSVSKAWKSLIDSSRFITNYSNQQKHLLVRYHHHVGSVHSKEKYVSIVDDDSFPHQRISITLPLCVRILKDYYSIGSSHGLLCFYGLYRDYYGPNTKTEKVVLWNPSVRKAAAFVVPNSGDRYAYGTVLGFGVCRQTNDPKIVKIAYMHSWEEDMEIPRQVEVFTLSTRSWRSSYGTNLPRKSIEFGCDGRCIDGFYYWLATDRSTIDDDLWAYNLIISFDITSEEFREVNLPDSLVYDGSKHDLSFSSLRESLVVLRRNEHDENVVDVWLMEDGVSKPFTKLFTIYSPNAVLYCVWEFRKSGEPVFLTVDNDADLCKVPTPLMIAVYEPKSKHISNLDLGINGECSFDVYSYVETLSA
ncbi:putative F-box domain-containing protein [Helianthus debilis subsp. tardiflorus]